MSDITIRLAKPCDALRMAEIHALSWEAAYKDFIPADYLKKTSATRPALWQRIITNDNSSHYVIMLDQTIVGIMCVTEPKDDKVEIFNDTGIDEGFYELHGLYLHPDYYRRGIGTKAMEYALQKAHEAGKSNIILWVFAENSDSIKFYERCGFVSDGAFKTLNLGKELKVIRMRRPLKI